MLRDARAEQRAGRLLGRYLEPGPDTMGNGLAAHYDAYEEDEVYRFLDEGIPALLADSKSAGKTVIIATSKPEAYARRILEHFGLAQYCDFICGATLDETRTDKAEVIAYALETAGITGKSRVVMVGDREHDVLGAKKNGLPCIGAVYGYGTAEELTAAGAAALADTVDELHKLLLG
mgnify:FL=1